MVCQCHYFISLCWQARRGKQHKQKCQVASIAIYNCKKNAILPFFDGFKMHLKIGVWPQNFVRYFFQWPLAHTEKFESRSLIVFAQWSSEFLRDSVWIHLGPGQGPDPLLLPHLSMLQFFFFGPPFFFWTPLFFWTPPPFYLPVTAFIHATICFLPHVKIFIRSKVMATFANTCQAPIIEIVV